MFWITFLVNPKINFRLYNPCGVKLFVRDLEGGKRKPNSHKKGMRLVWTGTRQKTTKFNHQKIIVLRKPLFRLYYLLSDTSK